MEPGPDELESNREEDAVDLLAALSIDVSMLVPVEPPLEPHRLRNFFFFLLLSVVGLLLLPPLLLLMKLPVASADAGGGVSVGADTDAEVKFSIILQRFVC